MTARNSLRQQSRRMALCGLMAALAITVMLLGGIIPLATFACPMLAMICMLPIVYEFGTKVSLLVYAAVSIIVLLMVPDKELAMFFLALGYYPSIKPMVDRIRSKAIRFLVKCGIFSAAMVAMYSLLLFLFHLTALVEEFQTYSAFMLFFLLFLGNFTFLLFDRALFLLNFVYVRRLRKRLLH